MIKPNVKMLSGRGKRTAANAPATAAEPPVIIEENEMLWYQPRKRQAPKRLTIGNTVTRDYDFAYEDPQHAAGAPTIASSAATPASEEEDEIGDDDDSEDNAFGFESSSEASSGEEPSTTSTSYYSAEEGSDDCSTVEEEPLVSHRCAAALFPACGGEGRSFPSKQKTSWKSVP